MTTTALGRVEELVAKRHELLKRIPEEIDPAVVRSLKIELRLISREARRLVASLTGRVDKRLLQEAVSAGLK